MKKRFCLSGLALAFLGFGVVHGQVPTSQPDPVVTLPSSPPTAFARPDTPPAVALPAPLEVPDAAGPPVYPPGVSSYLAYPRWAGCCGEVGKNGPIDSELYMRIGSAVPIANGLFGSVMKPGLEIETGVRVLFFNPPEDAAWTADLRLMNQNFVTQTLKQATIRNFQSQTINPLTGQTTTTTIPSFPVTPRGLNNTTVSLALGREWYLWGSTCDCKTKEPKWRVGFDLGGEWGSQKLDLLEIRHKTVMVGGMLASIHTDMEVPCGCCILYGGVRMEYGYLYGDILQKQNDTDLQTISATLTVGLRY